MPVIQIKNYLCVFASILAASAPAVAEEPEEAIARCARIATVGDRLLCLENALRTSSRSSGETVHAEAEELPEVDDEALTSVSDDLPVDPMTAPVADTPAVMPDTAPGAVVTSTVVAGGSGAAATAPAVVSQQPELGAEQVNELAAPKNTRIPATVVDFRMVGTGRLRFTLDNGQVWQQTGDDDAGINRKLRHYESVPAEMWQARSGGYRIYLVPIDRTVRVRRLK